MGHNEVGLSGVPIMSSKCLFRAALAMAACAVVSSCGDSTAPPNNPRTVDELFADLGEIQSVAGSVALGFAGAPAPAMGPASRSSECSYSADSQSFVCSPITAHGLTVTRSYQLLDASNAAQSAFNPRTTAAIRTITDVSGTITGGAPAQQVVITAHDDNTISGLLTGTATVNGSGTSTSALTSGSLAFTTSSTTKTIDLVLPRRGGAGRYPQSGRIEVTVTSEYQSVAHTMTMTMTFDGTSVATLVMVSSHGTVTCKIDMASPGAAANCKTSGL